MNPQRLIYRLGDFVRIRSGPFANLTGKIEGINQSKSLLKVKLEYFGRTTAVKVSFYEAEKAESPLPWPPVTTQN